MLKQHDLTFSILQKSLDALAVLIFWLIAFTFRFYVFPGGSQGQENSFIKLSPILIILTLFFFHINGLYRSQRFSSRLKEVSAVLKANGQAVLAFVIVLYFFADGRVSRLTILNYFVVSQIGLVLLRFSIRNYLRYLRRKGKNLRHVLLIGDGNQLSSYVDSVRTYKDSGIQFCAWLESKELIVHHQIPKSEISVDEAKATFKPDAIVIGFSTEKGHRVKEIIHTNYNDVIPIQVLPDMSYSLIGHEIEEFEGLPIITLNKPRLDSFDLITKRIFDIVLTAPALIILSPVYLLIALGVRLSSPGPIFYGQERMSLDGKSFLMWKFRSMKIDSEANASPGWTVANDPRKTKFGSFLRKTSLDELPQIWNVFKGDMSLVGPRPERPFYVDKFRHEIPAYMLRHKMKTGITGWAQVNGWRGDTSLEKRIECDLWYIKNWSLWLDFKIIFLTFWKGFINKNAY